MVISLIERVADTIKGVDTKTMRPFREYLRSEQYQQKQRLLDEKIKRLVNRDYDEEIKKKTIPNGGSRLPDYSEVEDSFSTAVITSEASRKGNHIARRMVELTGTSLEIYLYSLDNRGSFDNPVARDLYVAKEQEVWPAVCEVSGYGVILSALDIKKNLGKRVIGWSHSHGSLPPFFSDYDRHNITRLMETNALKKRVTVSERWYGGHCTTVEYDVRYTPAIVFNANGAKPFVAIAVEYVRRYDNQKVFHINEHARLQVIEEANGIDMDPASIDRQILERCGYNGRKLEEIVNYRPEPKREETVAPAAEEKEKAASEAKPAEQISPRAIIRSYTRKPYYRAPLQTWYRRVNRRYDHRQRPFPARHKARRIPARRRSL